MNYKEQLLKSIVNSKNVEEYVYQPLEVLGYERESIAIYLELLYLIRFNTELSDKYIPIPEDIREMWEAHISINLNDYIHFSNSTFGKVINYVGLPEEESYRANGVYTLIGNELPALKKQYEKYLDNPLHEW